MFGFGKSNKSDPPAAGAGTGDFASGAEQDRYGSHFTVGDAAVDKVKDAAKRAANYKGEGAEQDRYGAHFAGFGLDQQKVQQAVQSIINARGAGAEQDRYAGHFGLGFDGLERARRIAATQGVGAEQVCPELR
jgi:hypothetical protein